MKTLNHIIPTEILWVLALIFIVLSLSSISFYIRSKTKPSKQIFELILRTNSWWYLAFGIFLVVIAPPIISTIIIGFVSFMALRELLSIGTFREADRVALFVAYFAIPIQYYLAYNNYYEAFLCFIPLVMFIGLPFILIMTGQTKHIIRSMISIPAVLLLTVYMLSHLILIFNIETANFSVGAGGLILYLILLTSFNDVFQYVWGKLLGHKKILPNISPNKTWAGFIGGVLTTSVLGYLLRFLTPLDIKDALLIGLAIGVMGFIGDSMVSAIKRDLQIKDTGDLIPGHGGALDRLDSILITAPIYFHLIKYLIQK